jgi:glycosyltransferase involved in cell wall biosynthesis
MKFLILSNNTKLDNGGVPIANRNILRLLKQYNHKAIIQRFYTNGKFDLCIVVGAWNFLNLISIFFLKKNKIKYIYAPKGMLTEYEFVNRFLQKRVYFLLFEKLIIRYAHKIWFTSEIEYRLSAQLHKFNNLIFAPEIFYSFYSLPKKYYLNDKKIINLNKINIVTVGRFSERKNLKFIYDLFYSLEPEDRDKYNLILIGEPVDKYRDDFDKLISNLKKIISITTIKYLNQSQIIQFYYKADLFFFPSYAESYGFIIPEALSFNKIVLTSCNVGASEYFYEFKNLQTFNPLIINSAKILLNNLNLNKIRSKKNTINNVNFNNKISIQNKITLDKIINSVF